MKTALQVGLGFLGLAGLVAYVVGLCVWGMS